MKTKETTKTAKHIDACPKMCAKVHEMCAWKGCARIGQHFAQDHGATKVVEFKKGDRVQIKAEILKERGYTPSDEVGIIVEGPYKNDASGPNTYTVKWADGDMKLSDASELKAAPAPRPTFRTHVIHKDDFTAYARDLGVWDGLCEDHGISPDADEIEITVTAVKKVA